MMKDLEHRLRARACALVECAGTLVEPTWRRLEVLFDAAGDGTLAAHTVVALAGGGPGGLAGADCDYYLAEAGAAATALRRALDEASVAWNGRVAAIVRGEGFVTIEPLAATGGESLCTIRLEDDYLDRVSVLSPPVTRALVEAGPAIVRAQARFAPFREGPPARVDWDRSEITFDKEPPRPTELVGVYLAGNSVFVWPWMATIGDRQVAAPRLERLRDQSWLPVLGRTQPCPMGPNVARSLTWLVGLELDAEGVYEGDAAVGTYYHAVF